MPKILDLVLPATFQRLMDLVLAGLQMSHCLVYIDDIILVGRTFKEHLSNFREVLSRVKKAGLKLKLGNCALLHNLNGITLNS